MKTKKTKLVKPKSFKPLRVLTWDDPRLRIVAKDVKNPKTKKFRRFIQRLLVTFPIFGGVGIAAPQVGESLRVIIIASKPTLAYPDAPTMEPIVMINPVLCFRSKKMEKGWEGCGSLPGMRAIVLRYAWIEARYTDMSGKKRYVGLDGLPARIFQHELDHLDGILFIDSADLGTCMDEDAWQKMIAKKQKNKVE